MIDEFKPCRACGELKSKNDFHKNANRDGRFNTCKKCQYNRLQEFRTDPKHKERFKTYRRNNSLTQRYGISITVYENMVKEQKNRCKICNNAPDPNGARQNRNLSIDHCHKTGKVRGLLCHLCNRGIGLFREKEEIMENAIRYLKYHS